MKRIARLLAPLLALATTTRSAIASPIDTDPADEKSGVVATALAGGGTVLGAGLIATGIGIGLQSDQDSLAIGLELAGVTTLMAAPSFGHVYAGETGHALKMSLLRTGVLVGGTAAGAGLAFALGRDCTELCQGYSVFVLAGFGVGAAGAAVLGAYDIFDAHRAAGRHNQQQRAVAIVPIATEHGYGVGVAGNF